MSVDEALLDGFWITARWLAAGAEAGRVINFDLTCLRRLPTDEWAREARRMAARRPSLAAALVRAAPLEIRQTDHPQHSVWQWLQGVAIGWRQWREGERPASIQIREHQLCL